MTGTDSTLLALCHCSTCTLCSPSGPRPIFGHGNPEARIIFVGEGAGAHEAEYGKPFVGPSGKLLNRALADHGIDRTDVYCTNAVLCRPQDNRTPTFDEIKACRDRLLAEIAQFPNRHIVVALGASAAKALTGSKTASIVKLQGQIHWHEELQCHLTFALHPAAILRNNDGYPDFTFVLKRVLWLLKQPKEPIVVVPTDYKLEDSVDMALQRLAWMTENVRLCSCDIETDDVDWQRERLIQIGWSWWKGKAYIIREPILFNKRVVAALKKFFEHPDIKFIYHNGKFDTQFIKYHLGINATIDYDTMLMHHALDERGGGGDGSGQGTGISHGLKPLSQRFCVHPDTRIFKTDFTWVAARDVRVGDTLVAFDKNVTGGATMQPTTVEAVGRRFAQTYKIQTIHGEVTISAEHLWPCYRWRKGEKHWTSSIQWESTEQLYQLQQQPLKKRQRRQARIALMHFVQPWEVDQSRDGGYIAGLLDGEAHLTIAPNMERLTFHQNEGVVLQNAVTILQEKNCNPVLRAGRSATSPDKTTEVSFCASHRGARPSMRIVGMFRPVRMLTNSVGLWTGHRNCAKADVLSIEPTGVQEVVSIKTSTGTFIAEGFLTHNCDAPSWADELKPFLKTVKGVRAKYSAIPVDIMTKYHASDLDYTLRLYHALVEQHSYEPPSESGFPMPLDLCRTLTIPAANALAEIEMTGVLVDLPKVQELRDSMGRELAALEIEIGRYAETLAGFDPTKFKAKSPKQVAQVLYDGLHCPLIDGKRTTDVEALRQFQKSHPHPFINALIQYRITSKLYSTYVLGIEERLGTDLRIHSDFLLHGTTCVTGDTYIATPTGLYRADELVPAQVTARAVPYASKTGVHTIDGVATTSHIWKVPDRPTIEIQLAYGHTIRCTPEHPLYTKRGWVQAAAIKVTDSVLMGLNRDWFSQQVPEIPNYYGTGTLTEALSTLIGYYCAYGTLQHAEVITFTCADHDILLHITKLLRQVSATPTFDMHTSAVTVQDPVWSTWFATIVGTTGAGWDLPTVPQIIRRAPKELVAAFLEAYLTLGTFAAYVDRSEKRSTPRLHPLIELRHPTHEFARVIQQFLWNFNIRARIGARTGKRCVAGPSKSTVLIIDRYHAHTLAQTFHLASSTKQQVLNGALSYKPTTQRRLPNIDDAVYVQVVGSYIRPYATVYDFTVPDTASFIANNMVVHNTGRLSSRDPNLQNIPRTGPIRDLFIASPDYTLFNVDYNQLELRVAAWASGDPVLIADLDSDDFHQTVADRVFAHVYADIAQALELQERGVWVAPMFGPNQAKEAAIQARNTPLDMVLQKHGVLMEIRGRHERHLYDNPPDDYDAVKEGPWDMIKVLTKAMKKHLRSQSKYVTFGVLYGRGPASLANGELQCSIPEAVKYIENFHSRYAVLSTWIKDVIHTAIYRGWLETYFGRRRRFHLVTPQTKWRVEAQGTNFPCQGTATDMTLTSLVILHDIAKKTGWFRILFTVHDAITFEVKQGYERVSAAVIVWVMGHRVPNRGVTFAVDVDAGRSWGSAKKYTEQYGPVPVLPEEPDIIAALLKYGIDYRMLVVDVPDLVAA